MTNNITITSTQNPLVKKIRLLKEKSRERKKTGLFVIEGRRELELALKGGYEIDTVLTCSDILEPSKIKLPPLPTVQLSKTVYEHLAHRGSTEGVLALARTKPHDLQSILLQEHPLLLVAEAPEKPGNLGALLRTADAAKVDAVLVANPKADLYNPNCIRSSVGGVFTNQVGMGTSDEIIHFLQANNIRIFAAALTGSQNYLNCNFSGRVAIVVGTESTGLSAKWLEHSYQNIYIPMRGEIDSMNVSVSAAILIFEAIRQREA